MCEVLHYDILAVLKSLPQDPVRRRRVSRRKQAGYRQAIVLVSIVWNSEFGYFMLHLRVRVAFEWATTRVEADQLNRLQRRSDQMSLTVGVGVPSTSRVLYACIVVIDVWVAYLPLTPDAVVRSMFGVEASIGLRRRKRANRLRRCRTSDLG